MDKLFKAPPGVLRCGAVKEPVKLPFVFLFILICVSAVLSALSVFSLWGSVDAAQPFTFSYFLLRLPRAAFDTLVPSVVLSIVLLGLRMARHRFSRFLGFAIVLAVGYIVMVNGMIWLSSVAAREKAVRSARPQYLRPLTFLRIGDAEVAPAAVTGGRLAGVLLYEPGRADTRLSVFPGGTAEPAGSGLAVSLSGSGTRRIEGDPEVPGAGVFAPDRFTGLFLRDIATLTTDFERLMREALPQFFAASFALVFLSAASLMLLRLTRWPLANVVLLACAMRGYFSLYHLLATRVTQSMAAVVTDPLLVILFPSAAFLALGLILLLIDILFIPASRWTGGQAA